MEEKINKIYKCDCYAEAVEIEKEDDQIYMCFWSLGLKQNNKPTLKHRLWLAWRAFNNNLFTDECILNLETAKNLGNDLIKLSS